MKVGTARAAATQWVADHAGRAAGFRGAFFSGSTVGLGDDAELPEASDVDVMVVTAHDDAPPKPGKFRHLGTLLEVTYLPWQELSSAEDVLSSLYLAPSFLTDTIITDPTGHLHKLYAQVAPRFAEPEWVWRRCEHARSRITGRLATIDPTAAFHDQVTTWLFGTSVTTLIPLIAARRNPTVRRRYLAVRQTLTDYRLADRYPVLLELLGCADLSRDRVQRQLDDLGRTFDAAAEVAVTPFLFSSDITALARPVAIDASQQLIDAGDHREAVFWMVATFARCHKILAADAPDRQRALTPSFEAAVADLGISSTADLLARAGEVTRFVPRLWETAETILSTEPSPARS